MSNDGRWRWKVCLCGVVTDAHQTECPMALTFNNIPHKLKKIKISTEDLEKLINKGLFIASNHAHPQIESIQNKRPPSL
ncbi:MAG: hypothetical protein ABIA08_00885 [bacterium]